jgi:adenylate cyclase
MAERSLKQRTAAILAADAAGFTRLMAENESSTIATLERARAVFAEHIESNHGRVVDTAGDSVLAVFETTAGAVLAGLTIQKSLAQLYIDVPEQRRMLFRIGIHLGDIHEKEDGSIYGDGVNFASRLQATAEPGGIAISDVVQATVKGRVEASFEDLGLHRLKNIEGQVHVYRIVEPGRHAHSAGWRRVVNHRPAAIAAISVLIIGVALMVLSYQRDSSPPMVTATGAPTRDAVLAMPAGPSVAVLPFENLSGDKTQDYFANGITQDVIAALARFRDLRVVPSRPTEKYKGTDANLRRVGQELGAAYVMEGSVRRSGDLLRVSAQLLSVADGSLTWAETYDRRYSADDLFSVQDAIVGSVVSAIGGADGIIARKRVAAATNARPQNLNSYECVLLAYAYGREVSADSHLRARSCLEAVVRQEPNYADALSALSMIYEHQAHMGFNATTEYEPLLRALELSQRAVDLEPNNATAHRQLAMVYFHLHQLEPFYQHAKRALELNPNDPTNLGYLGIYISWSGKLQWGNSLVRKAMTLNPEIPQWFNQVLAFEHYLAREYEDGLAIIEKIHEKGNYWNDMWLLVYLGQLGRRDEAVRVYARLQTMRPGYSVSDYGHEAKSWNLPDDWIAAVQDGLRKAGVPETSTKR